MMSWYLDPLPLPWSDRQTNTKHFSLFSNYSNRKWCIWFIFWKRAYIIIVQSNGLNVGCNAKAYVVTSMCERTRSSCSCTNVLRYCFLYKTIENKRTISQDSYMKTLPCETANKIWYLRVKKIWYWLLFSYNVS
jgi:hypothetical protein